MIGPISHRYFSEYDRDYMKNFITTIKRIGLLNVGVYVYILRMKERNHFFKEVIW